MILSASFSKPAGDCSPILGRPYIRIKIKLSNTSSGQAYFAELFTEKQAFHRTLTAQELDSFVAEHAGKTFLNCIWRTETEEITVLGSKKGHITRLAKKLPADKTVQQQTVSGRQANSVKTAETGTITYSTYSGPADSSGSPSGIAGVRISSMNRVKNYILEEGRPVPFLVHLGIMTPQGKVIASKYDKFRQINRFLEYIDDILPEVQQKIAAETQQDGGTERPLRIADFGCGKSYLTFAVYYYLTELKHIETQITGLDLKEDVIAYCNKLAQQFGCKGLTFAVGDIAGYHYEHAPDIVITLHACDTATDYALAYAVKQKTKAILSVPCCQHELNTQLDTHKAQTASASPEFASLLKYGIIKERFAALATDALRADYLENAGYAVQILEFIDMAHTPKNLLIRAVLKNPAAPEKGTTDSPSAAAGRAQHLTDALSVSPTLRALLQD